MIISASNAEWEAIANGLAMLSGEKIVFPIRVSYMICKNQLQIEKALGAYRMARDELIERYSNGKGKITEKDNPELFQKLCLDIASISKDKVEADISAVSLSQLSVGGKYPFNVISALSFMLTEEEE